ncbi:zinc finger FYVE domain-containing protein 9 isoform X2 [Lampris incognitus]|uniref:zinc finger FYVE domain-containing protein 9 isoform X2 n=1 Tax=Lampris incognitus TaxID=2546036 RepID=UPI0024B58980|nr:zinc finger FYVE domain-containing protein 9 isoform X2 [Lampris incognitus]
MENYFQAEAFNLDKVLDEFEQNEDETDTPTLSDAKWTQILAPPPHLLSLNPALAHTDLSPRESPLPFKAPPDPPTSGPPGADPTKRLPGPEPPSPWGEERPADVHSPPLPQPNIGKLVGTDDLSPPRENGCPASPEVNGLSKEGSSPPPPPPDGKLGTTDQLPYGHGEPRDAQKGGGASVGHTFFTFEEGPRQQETTAEGSHTGLEPVSPSREPTKEVSITADPQDSDQERQATSSEGDRTECLQNGGEAVQDGGSEKGNGVVPERLQLEEEEREETMEERRSSSEGWQEQLSSTASLLNGGMEQERGGCAGPHKEVGNEGKNEMEGSLSSITVSSKEDSVTEEKEMEESKQESSYGGGRGGGGAQMKFNNNRLQPVSVPCGGARPKQPVSLKLQIPRPLSGQVQNQLSPPAGSKNKNLEGQCRTAAASETTNGGGEQGMVRVNGEGVDSASLLPAESPDNDLQAGQQGALSRKAASSLGEVAPVWVPDSQAPICMNCEVKFTFTKRRHHCRACGKVFCAACCSLKCRLVYMDRKEARVCVSCHSALMNGSLPREQRRVWFADGILPNGETASESPKPPAASPAPSHSPAASPHSNKSSGSEYSEAAHTPAAPVGSPVGSSLSLIPEDGLPPILISTGVKGGTGGHITDYAVEERPSEIVLMQQLEEGGPDPLVFVLNANLLAMVKLVNYVNRKCWYVTTKGMHAVGQAEVVILLQCLPDEKTIPKDIFTHFVQLYQEALTGNVLSHLSHSFFTQSFLGSREHGGFLYISPSFQSLQDLLLPNPPYLFGILIQKWETPWAKVFPIRLMLRLGAEYRLYPCPLFSVRFRKPLFGETGHTIMNLLADFRNYQYTLPVVKGLVVDMEVKKTCIKIPSNRYNELMKAMNKSNEHVLAIGACFNDRADSHLVCVQNDDGNYQTQAISIHHQPRKVTGACFFVFSGALKASSGYLAKTSIVEDGVMVQITAETMDSIRQALRDMKDFTITCGKADQEESQEQVHIQWMEDDHNFNKGVISPIDGKSMESITSVKIFHGSEFKANGKVIRWTEVFFLQSEDQPNGLSDPADHSRLTENVARAFCMALCPHLKLLKEDGMAKLGLRVTLDSDQVGYLVGSNGQPLLPQYLSDLDSALIPVIHSGACQLSEGPVVMELVFYILEIIS